MTFAGLGESTATLMNHKVSEWAMEDAEVAWDRVPVEVFVPVRPIAHTVIVCCRACTDGRPLAAQIFPLHFQPPSKVRKVPSRVVIQGKITQGRRDYDKIIKELHLLMMGAFSSFTCGARRPDF